MERFLVNIKNGDSFKMKLIIGLTPNIAEVDYYSLDTTYLDCITKAIQVPETLFALARKNARDELLKRAASVLCEYYHTTNIELALDLYFDKDNYVELYFYHRGQMYTLEEFKKKLETCIVIGDLRERHYLREFISICC